VTAASGLDTTDQVLAALAQAERSIAAVEQSSRDIRQPELNQRLRRVAALAREILTLLEEDPRDLRRARKFLNVYLDGVQRVVEGYARTHSRAASPDLDANFRRVLTSIEEVFEEQRRKLLESDIMDLDADRGVDEPIEARGAPMNRVEERSGIVDALCDLAARQERSRRRGSEGKGDK
jgi:5-bromo-4-chloroindolyl phosphate hydrolysis protein